MPNYSLYSVTPVNTKNKEIRKIEITKEKEKQKRSRNKIRNTGNKDNCNHRMFR
jgi:hypothetical protein